MNTLTVTGMYFVLISLFIVFLFIGTKVISVAGVSLKSQMSLVISSSYFIGMAIFMAFWRTLVLLTDNAKISLAFTLVFSLAVICRMERQSNYELCRRCFLFLSSIQFLFLLSSVSIFVFLFWSRDSIGDVLNCAGSLHSGRYSNIAIYINENNNIPVLGQNYGQSMLASIPMMFGLKNPFLALNMWLSLTLVNLALLVYSLCLKFGVTVKNAVPLTFLILFGNTAFSFWHVLSIDAGSPFILVGYTDTVASIGTFVVILGYLNQVVDSSNDTLEINFKSFLVIFGASVFWNMSSPQNTIIFFVLIVLLLSAKMVTPGTNKNTLSKILLLFSACSIIGVMGGGMFTPSVLKDQIKLPGMMEIKDSGVKLYPGIPFHVGFGGFWQNGNLNVLSEGSAIRDAMASQSLLQGSVYLSIVSIIEQLITNSMKVMFWPLLGVVGLSLMISVCKRFGVCCGTDKSTKIYTRLLFVVLTTLAIGIIFNAFVAVSGYKWELSRFLIIGYFFGILSLAVVLNFVVENCIIPKSWFLLIIGIITIGPTLNSLLTIVMNIFYSRSGVSFIQKMSAVINSSDMAR